MARKTKAQQEQEYQEEQNRLWLEFIEQYPERFVKVMYDFFEIGQYNGFTVNKREDGYFFMADNEDSKSWCNRLLPVSVLDTENENRNNIVYALECAESVVKTYHNHQLKKLEREQKRVAALNKLTEEDRELLGL